MYNKGEHFRNPWEVHALAGYFRPSALLAAVPVVVPAQNIPCMCTLETHFLLVGQTRTGHSLKMAGVRGINASGMYSVLVREGMCLPHRFKLKTTLSPGCARVSVAEGTCVMDRKGDVPAYVHKEVHAAAVVIVLIKEYFPEFLLWHRRALPRMPFLKLLFDYPGQMQYTHTHTPTVGPILLMQTHDPNSTWLPSPLLRGKGNCGG